MYKVIHVDKDGKETVLYRAKTEELCQDYIDENITDEQFDNTAENYYYITD